MSRDAAQESKALGNLNKEDASKGPATVRTASAAEQAKLQATIQATEQAEMAAIFKQYQKDQILAKFKVEQKDIDFIAKQFDLPAAVAERELRLKGGNFDKAVAALLGSSA